MNATLLRMEFMKSLQTYKVTLLVMFALSISSYQIMNNLLFAGIITGVYLFMNNMAMDKKNNTFSFVNTLPVTRKQMINAKFISAFVYVIAGLAAGLILTAVLQLCGISTSLEKYSIIMLLAVGLLMIAINIPIYLIMKDKENYLSSVLMMVIMFGGLTLMSTDDVGSKMQDSILTSPYALGFMMLGLALVITVIAYIISMIVFTKRDLT